MIRDFFLTEKPRIVLCTSSLKHSRAKLIAGPALGHRLLSEELYIQESKITFSEQQCVTDITDTRLNFATSASTDWGLESKALNAREITCFFMCNWTWVWLFNISTDYPISRLADTWLFVTGCLKNLLGVFKWSKRITGMHYKKSYNSSYTSLNITLFITMFHLLIIINKKN